ncbi:hypothetical protein KCX83_17415 [Brucella oryzae]|uniref:hypothetical protein n=1 Tax=Brucella oryzae TaxID=335286 RepID=UPI001B813E31|nr:hypothetical protein [Brucella oryzae]MBR7654098.1 hypothetical protein [Brucella oryzae]
MPNPLFDEISGILDRNNFYADGIWRFNVNYLRFRRILVGTSRAHISIFSETSGYHKTYRHGQNTVERFNIPAEDRHFEYQIRTLDELYRTVTAGRLYQRLDICSDIISALDWLRANR